MKSTVGSMVVRLRVGGLLGAALLLSLPAMAVPDARIAPSPTAAASEILRIVASLLFLTPSVALAGLASNRPNATAPGDATPARPQRIGGAY